VKFLYKVWSKYDGFTPAQVPARRLPGGLLRLGWARYIEAVERGTEIWVYFHGPHAFENGVYVKGVAHAIDVDQGEVLLRIRQASTSVPLTDASTSARIAAIVAARGLQVFLLPDALDVAPTCNVDTSAMTCAHRSCDGCQTWQALPLIAPRNLGWPARLPQSLADFVPAYWVIPPRNFIYMRSGRFKLGIRRTDELFRRFKTGEKRLAFPLALGIREALATRGLDSFDAIVPIPLSPDKEAAGEIHRTRLLARELARLLGVPVREPLSLDGAISKRRLRGDQGYSASLFEYVYRRKLVINDTIDGLQRIALIDDVCTEGSTIRASTSILKAKNPALEVVAATAGQMTVRAAVLHEDDLTA
jgi:hypothetical protein